MCGIETKFKSVIFSLFYSYILDHGFCPKINIYMCFYKYYERLFMFIEWRGKTYGEKLTNKSKIKISILFYLFSIGFYIAIRIIFWIRFSFLFYDFQLLIVNHVNIFTADIIWHRVFELISARLIDLLVESNSISVIYQRHRYHH